MKAARIFGPFDIRYEEVSTPSPGTEEALIKVKAEGVCGSDLLLLSGDFSYIRDGRTTYPFIPGHEWAGEVVEVGDGVKRFEVGDAVVGEPSLGCGQCSWCLSGRYDLCPQRQEVGSLRNKDGGYAQYIVMPERHLYKVPIGIPMEEASLTEPAADALYALQKAKVSGRSLVVILGDGPIGLLSLQIATAFGAARVVVAGLSDYKLSVAQELGATEVINAQRENLGERVADLTQGQGAEVVVEASGSPQAIAETVHLVRPGGQIIVLGIYGRGPIQFDMTPLVLKDASLIGSHVSPNCFVPTLNLMASGKIRTGPLITHRFPLSAVSDALRAQEELEQQRIKIIVIPE